MSWFNRWEKWLRSIANVTQHIYAFLLISLIGIWDKVETFLMIKRENVLERKQRGEKQHFSNIPTLCNTVSQTIQKKEHVDEFIAKAFVLNQSIFGRKRTFIMEEERITSKWLTCNQTFVCFHWKMSREQNEETLRRGKFRVDMWKDDSFHGSKFNILWRMHCVCVCFFASFWVAWES